MLSRPSLQIVLSIAGAATLLGQTPAIDTTARLPLFTTSEGSLRRIATTRKVPQYPSSAVARGVTGVVVVEATVGPGPARRVEAVEVLQSPDETFSASARAAVSAWTFPPAQRPSYLRAKLTFYFQIQNGKGVVFHPDQVPGNEDVFAAWDRPLDTGAANSSLPGRATPMDRHIGDAEEIDDDEFADLLADSSTVVLDVRDRDQFAGGAHPRARNIPDDEVLTRARAELPASATIVIDCSRNETALCRFAHDQLRDRGFKDVLIYLP